MGQVINAQSLFNRVRMWLAGVSFHGQRDLYEQFGWIRQPNYQNFIAAYARQGIAKRVIDAPVLGIWANPPQLGVDNVEFADAWNEVVQTQTLYNKIIRLDKLAGLGRYAIMVVGFDDGGKLDAPITKKAGRKVIYMQPYHEGALSIGKYESDTKNPRYGKPVMYHVNPQRFNVDGITTQPASAQGVNAYETRQPFDVHWSRVVHIADGMLEDSVFGVSRLEVVFNDLNDVLKVSGGSAEAFWLLINRGMQVDVDKDVEMSPEDAAELSQEVEDYQHQLRRFMRTRGVKVTNLGSDPVDPKGVFDMLTKIISMGTGIPQLILMGAGIGAVSSRNDRSNWADRLAERVAEYGGPVVLKGVLDCLIGAGVLPDPVNLEVSWPEAFKMDPLERAQTSAQMARSAVNLIRGAVHAAPIDPNTGQPMTSGPLFSNDEMRRMVSFGKHPPVFDSPVATGDVPATGDPASLAPDAAQTPPKPVPAGGASLRQAPQAPAPIPTPPPVAGTPPDLKSKTPGPRKTPSKPLGVKA